VLFHSFDIYIYIYFVWRGTGGGRPGEKGAGGVREAEEEGMGSGITKVVGSGRKRENYATLCNRKNA